MINSNDIIIVPQKLHQFSRNGWNLQYDPVNVTWMRLNNDGLKIVDTIKKHKTVDKAASILARNLPGESLENIKKSVVEFVSNMVKIGFLHVGEYRKREIKHYFQKIPTEVYLLMTYRCNLKCKYCYNIEDRSELNAEINKKRKPCLSLEEYKKIVGEAKTLGIKKFIFTGGEALLNPITPQLGRFVLKQGFEAELITNGTLINESNVKNISESFSIITVSLDSLNKNSHEKMRGTNTFNKVLDSIKLLKSYDVKIRANSVITQVNVCEMLNTWRGVLEELKCDYYTPSLYTPDTNDQEINSKFLPDMKKLLSEQNRIRNYFKNAPGIASRPARIRFSCGIGNGEISISPEGFVYPCHTLHKPELRCGDLREVNLGRILRDSPIMKKLREFNVNDIKTCRDCDFKYLCGGGCLAMNYNIHGDFFSHNNFYCEYLKQEQIERMWTSTMLNLMDSSDHYKQNNIQVNEYERRSA